MDHFSHVIFHNGEMFLAAAQRCMEHRRDEETGQPNTLLFPAEHCAIIACEMFLKSISATPSKGDDRQVTIKTWKGAHGHVDARLVKRQLNTKVGEKVRALLKDEDVSALGALKNRFSNSRYPFEHDTTRPESPHALDLAQRLCLAIGEAVKPNEAGDVLLG